MTEGIEQFGAGVELNSFIDVDLTFRNARFGVSANYKDQDGNLPTVLIVDLVNADGDVRDDQILSIGKGFSVVDGGAGIEHANPKHNKPFAGFGKGSKGQTFIDSMAAAEGGLELMKAHGEDIGGGPRLAAFWEGLSVEYGVDEIAWGKPDEKGDRKTFQQPKATAVYGWDGLPQEDEEDEDVVVPVKTPAKKTPPAKKAPKATAKVPEGPYNDFGIDGDVYDALVALAKESATYDDFVIAAYDTDAIADDAVQAAVDDEAAGIWSKR